MEQNVSLSTLADAVNLSEDTLNTYVSCGILRGESKEGEVFFSLTEIQTIFGDIAVDRIASSAANTTSQNEASSPAAPVPQAEEEDVLKNTNNITKDPAASETDSPAIETVEPEAPILDSAPLASPLTDVPPSPELLSVAAALREQIEQLRHERDWLRSRIERLESRSERDQMLILSQSENVRKLITTPPKRGWLTLLPWNKE